MKASLLVDKIAEREAIAPTNDEVDAEVQRIAKQQREPVAAVRKKLQKDGVLSRIAYQIRSNKTLNFLFEHARKEAGEPEPVQRSRLKKSRPKKKQPNSAIVHLLERVRNRDNSDVPVHLLAFSVGVIVANIYYVQPLLAAMARTFSVSASMIGLVAMLTQVGTAHRHAGLRSAGRQSRPAGAAHRAALRRLRWRCAAWLRRGICFGFRSRVSPWARAAPRYTSSFLSPRSLLRKTAAGACLGTVFSGLLIGILLARTFSGVVASFFGWRSVYAIAALAMLGLMLLLRARLPKLPPQNIASVAGSDAVARGSGARSSGAARIGVPGRGAALRLQRVLDHAGVSASDAAVSLRIVGRWACSDWWEQPAHCARRWLGASPIGADRGSPSFSRCSLRLASFLLLGAFGKIMAGLIAGVVLLDIGVQSGHVANQTRIYALDATARSRLNTVYMFCYFTGGSHRLMARGDLLAVQRLDGGLCLGRRSTCDRAAGVRAQLQNPRRATCRRQPVAFRSAARLLRGAPPTSRCS